MRNEGYLRGTVLSELIRSTRITADKQPVAKHGAQVSRAYTSQLEAIMHVTLASPGKPTGGPI